MSKLSDFLGTIATTFQIGIGGTGARILRFKNGFQGNLSWTPTATRTITIPDASGIVQLSGEQPIGSPEGLTLIYPGGSAVNITAGRAVIGGTGTRSIALLSITLSKILTTAWAAGDGGGGKFAGTVSANQTWHVFIIRNTSTGAVDAGFDTSVTGANVPSGWVGRMIGSVMTDGSGNIRPFVQNGDLFQWTTAVQDFSSASATPTSTSNLQTLTVPTGVAVIAFGRMATNNASALVALYGSTPAVTPDLIVYSSLMGLLIVGRFELTTNTSGQILFYADVAGSFGQIRTWGFYHPRGAY